jgi:hypothetical protein
VEASVAEEEFLLRAPRHRHKSRADALWVYLSASRDSLQQPRFRTVHSRTRSIPTLLYRMSMELSEIVLPHLRGKDDATLLNGKPLLEQGSEDQIAKFFSIHNASVTCFAQPADAVGRDRR